MASDQRSLFGDILDWMLSPLLLVWPLFIAIGYGTVHGIANQILDRSLQASIDVIAQHVYVKNERVELHQPLRSSNLLQQDDLDQSYWAIYDIRGRLLAGDQNVIVPDRNNLHDYLRQGTRFSNPTINGKEVRMARTMLYISPEKSDYFIDIAVAETLHKRDALIADLVKGVIMPQLLLLPLLLPLAWMALSRGLLPLSAIQNAIRRRSLSDFSAINPQLVPEEISPLIDSFNALLKRLERAVESQRNFMANAAHQMKTPLAGLQAQAELASRLDDPQEINRSLQLIALSAQRSSRIINQLLLLARSENLYHKDCVDCDVVELVKEVTTEWVDKALAKNVDLGVDCALSTLTIKAMPLMLKELLNNLIDNAIRYGVPLQGGVITVYLRLLHAATPHPTTPTETHARDQVVIEVEDNGGGLTTEQQKMVFERFYRISHDNSGSGLGLAIVKEIAEFHNGSVEVLNRLDDPHTAQPGSIFRVTLPL